VILPDQKTLIGYAPDWKNFNERRCSMEDITSENHFKPLIKFGYFKKRIFHFHYNEFLNCLIVSSDGNKVVQFDMSHGKSNLKIVKNYVFDPDFKIKCIAISKHLAAVGGKNGSIHFLDLFKKTILDVIIDSTAVSNLYSMKLCSVLNNVYLCLTGCEYDYSDEKTDLFDVTEIMKLCL
jgi:hypothetical protein